MVSKLVSSVLLESGVRHSAAGVQQRSAIECIESAGWCVGAGAGVLVCRRCLCAGVCVGWSADADAGQRASVGVGI
jgi:hypothetical protein